MWLIETLLVILFINNYYSVNCCVYNTFNNTSVTLNGVRGIQKINGCFEPTPILQKVSLVQIINENVSIIHPDAFHDLPHLVDIILEKDQIEEVRPGAFRNLDRLYLIRLKFNKIRTVVEGVFNRLNLSELMLSDNNIEVVHQKAFDDMPNLSILLLNNNKIRSWNYNWFVGSLKITVLNFENNSIEAVPSRAFRNIRGLHVVNKLNVSTSIHLNANAIRHIDDNAFDGLDSLGWLFLQRNQIESFNATTLGSLRHLDWLRLDNNKLSCIPEEVFRIAPNVKYYLHGNPLSDACVRKFDISTKSNGHHNVQKFSLTLN